MEENLLRYEQWVMSSNQSEIFFGDKVPKCYKCNISAGNTLFIPTGERVQGFMRSEKSRDVVGEWPPKLATLSKDLAKWRATSKMIRMSVMVSK